MQHKIDYLFHGEYGTKERTSAAVTAGLLLVTGRMVHTRMVG